MVGSTYAVLGSLQLVSAGANNNQIEAAFTVLRRITHHLHTARWTAQTAELHQLRTGQCGRRWVLHILPFEGSVAVHILPFEGSATYTTLPFSLSAGQSQSHTGRGGTQYYPLYWVTYSMHMG